MRENSFHIVNLWDTLCARITTFRFGTATQFVPELQHRGWFSPFRILSIFYKRCAKTVKLRMLCYSLLHLVLLHISLYDNTNNEVKADDFSSFRVHCDQSTAVLTATHFCRSVDISLRTNSCPLYPALETYSYWCSDAVQVWMTGEKYYLLTCVRACRCACGKFSHVSICYDLVIFFADAVIAPLESMWVESLQLDVGSSGFRLDLAAWERAALDARTLYVIAWQARCYGGALMLAQSVASLASPHLLLLRRKNLLLRSFLGISLTTETVLRSPFDSAVVKISLWFSRF